MPANRDAPSPLIRMCPLIWTRPFLHRFDELSPVRPMRDEDPYFSSMRSRNSPPDFMPNFQNTAKKSQMNDGRPRRVQAQKSRTADGQV